MRRDLLVLRHAKSAWDTGAPTDFERPLAKRGRRDAPRMGAWLADHGLVPDLVVSSPAARARETALLVADALDFDAGDVVWDERIYDAGLDDLLAVLAGCREDAGRVLVIGHNPGLEELVLYLGGAGVQVPAEGKFFPTAALAHLRLPAVWDRLAPGAGEFVSLTRPRSLR